MRAAPTASANLDIVLNSFQLVRPNGTTVNGTSFSLTETRAAVAGRLRHLPLRSGVLTGDFDNNTTNAEPVVNFALDVFANGTYKLDLVQGFGSLTTFSSANGALDAGGPDPVHTLTIGTGQRKSCSSRPNPWLPHHRQRPAPATGSILAGVGLCTTRPDRSATRSQSAAQLHRQRPR